MIVVFSKLLVVPRKFSNEFYLLKSFSTMDYAMPHPNNTSFQRLKSCPKSSGAAMQGVLGLRESLGWSSRGPPRGWGGCSGLGVAHGSAPFCCLACGGSWGVWAAGPPNKERRRGSRGGAGSPLLRMRFHRCNFAPRWCTRNVGWGLVRAAAPGLDKK